MRVVWWGHASATLELAGLRVLTDPVLTARVAHLSRVDGKRPAAAAVRADLVVISHLHPDHLHVPSLRLLPAGTRVVGPRGTRQVVRRLPLQVEEVAPGGTVRAGDVRLDVVPAAHDGRRLPGSRIVGDALGFVLAADDRRVWFAGDTGLFDAMAAIGPVDTALVPVGGWGPTLGPEHLGPAEAAEAVRRVGARDALPLHYGTLWPTGLRRAAPGLFEQRCRRPGRDFAAALALAAPDARAHVVGPGSTVEL